MTTQSDPRIVELLELAANEGRPLALRPEAIIQLEDEGACVDPFTGDYVLPVLRWLTARGKAVAVQVALALLVILISLAPLPAQAQTAQPTRPSPVPSAAWSMATGSACQCMAAAASPRRSSAAQREATDETLR
jgi:hypothetical protein